MLNDRNGRDNIKREIEMNVRMCWSSTVITHRPTGIHFKNGGSYNYEVLPRNVAVRTN